MNFIKKWLTSIVLAVSGVLGLLLSLLVGMKVSYGIDASALGSPYAEMLNQSHQEATKAHEVLTDGSLVDSAKSFGISTEFGFLKAFGIIGVIVSVILILWAIVLLLKNLNVIKVENKAFDIVSLALPIAFVLATVGLLICSLVYANAQQDAILKLLNGSILSNSQIAGYASLIKLSATVKVGLYQPIILVISIIGALIVGTTTFLKLKNK